MAIRCGSRYNVRLVPMSQWQFGGVPCALPVSVASCIWQDLLHVFLSLREYQTSMQQQHPFMRHAPHFTCVRTYTYRQQCLHFETRTFLWCWRAFAQLHSNTTSILVIIVKHNAWNIASQDKKQLVFYAHMLFSYVTQTQQNITKSTVYVMSSGFITGSTGGTWLQSFRINAHTQ